MEKQAFLSLLRERLIKYELDEENTNKYIKQFERYFNTMTDDEINDQIVNYDGVEGIAQNIVKIIKKKKETSQTITSASKGVNAATITYPVIQLKVENVPDTVTYTTDNVYSDSPSEKKPSDSDMNPNDKTEPENKADNDIETTDENTDRYNSDLQSEDNYYNFKKKNKRGFSPAILSDNIQAEDNPKNANTADISSQQILPMRENKKALQNNSVSDRSKHFEAQKQTPSSHIIQSERKPVSNDRRISGKNRNINSRMTDNRSVRQVKTEIVPEINLNELDETFLEDTAIPNTSLFWIVTILTIPLTVPLFLAILFLFLTAFSFLAVSIVLLVAGLIFLIIAGTGLSLVGIIYGITQIFNTLPIGLFEIGLGVIIGGSAMLLGIPIYNTAIRFLPFVIKYLVVFFMYTMRKIKDLFIYIKRECAKQ